MTVEGPARSDGEPNGEPASKTLSVVAQRPFDKRAVLVLVDVQGFSYDETATATGVSTGTVKSRLSRARARVRDRLTERAELLPDEFRQVD